MIKSPGTDLFLCRKWVGISRFCKTPKDTKNRASLDALRDEAIRIRHWESVRDIDFHVARTTQESKLFEFIYFGSPFPGFRKRLLREWNPERIPEEYAWSLGKGSRKKILIDLGDEKPTQKGQVLKVGQSMSRLYAELTADFYRPLLVAEAFEKVFPGEFYAPGISELRVYQTVRRLRTWFKDSDIPLEISEHQGEYRLEACRSCEIIIRMKEKVKGRDGSRLDLVRERVGVLFSAQEVSELLNVSRRTASNLVQLGVKSGELSTVGKGKNVRYSFINREIKKAS